VAAKRAAEAELVQTFGGGGGASELTADDVKRVVSSVDDAMAQTAANVQVEK
jgi:hypothetical protein